jgi:hypothetical protein
MRKGGGGLRRLPHIAFAMIGRGVFEILSPKLGSVHALTPENDGSAELRRASPRSATAREEPKKINVNPAGKVEPKQGER